jgi:hypothetical protein
MRRVGLVGMILTGLLLIVWGAAAHAAYPPTGTPGTPVVTQDGVESIVFSSLQPSTPYDVVVHSAPVDLGTKMSDASGSLTVTFSTAGLDVGAHSVVATSPSGDVATATFTVVAAPGASPAGGSSGSSGLAAGGASAPSQASQLAFTGFRVAGLLAVALCLVAVGLVAVRIGRRRRGVSRGGGRGAE